MNIGRTLRMLRARHRARALVSKLTDDTSTIAEAQALNQGGRIRGDLLKVQVRLRVVTMLRAHGIEIPTETAMVASLRTRQPELKVAEEGIVAEAVASVAARLGVTPEDKKAARNRRQKQERDTRKANGDCVECPKGKVKRAAPGSTTCDECGQRRNTRIRNYRQRKKAQEGATQCGTKGAAKKNVGRKGTATAGQRTNESGRRNPRSEMLRGAIEGPAKTPQAERERSDADGGFPKSREQDSDAGGEPSRRPILGDTFGEQSDADEARGNVGGGPSIRAILGDTFGERSDADEARGDSRERGSRRRILGDTFGEGSDTDEGLGNVSRGPRIRLVLSDALREPSDADKASTDVGGMGALREGLDGVLGEAERDGQETEPQPSDADDESPHSPG